MGRVRCEKSAGENGDWHRARICKLSVVGRGPGRQRFVHVPSYRADVNPDDESGFAEVGLRGAAFPACAGRFTVAKELASHGAGAIDVFTDVCLTSRAFDAIRTSAHMTKKASW